MKWWNHINVNCDGSSGDAFSRMECQEAKPGTTLVLLVLLFVRMSLSLSLSISLVLEKES